MKKSTLCFFSIFIPMVIILFGSTKSYSIPAFARKYRTACTTCHTSFPKLNPFGTAFRNLGFQMPGGDDQYIKDDVVELGADAWKYAWPDGVWPGSIPGTPPIALRIAGAYVFNTQNTIKNDFKMPSFFNLLTAGTLSENISFYAGIHLFEEGGIGFLNRAYLQFDDVLDRWFPHYALNIRFGQFLPDFLPFVIHRGQMVTPYLPNSTGFGGMVGGHHGGEGSLEQSQRGIELKGILRHHFQYVFGLVNGNGIPGAGEEGNFDDNNKKDTYFRFAYKFGGIGLDGYDPKASEGVLQETENWIDNSFRIGIFAYKGNAKSLIEEDHDNGGMDMEEMELPGDFSRLGFDIDAYIGDFNIFGAIVRSKETYHEGEEKTFNSWFVETDHVIYPWLLSGLRYEVLDSDEGPTIKRIVPNITALVRANIKLQAELRINPDNFDSDHLDFIFRLDFAF